MYDYANDSSIPEESRNNMDLPRVENAVREILEAIGEDPERAFRRRLKGLLECMPKSLRDSTETSIKT